MKQYRHGDLLIVEVASLPHAAVRHQDQVLAYGEATGHAHRVDSADLYETDGVLYVRVSQSARLTHEEHGLILLPAGDYQVVRQREYVPKAPPRSVSD